MFDFELTDEEFYTLKKIGESYKVRAYFPELFEKWTKSKVLVFLREKEPDVTML